MDNNGMVHKCKANNDRTMNSQVSHIMRMKVLAARNSISSKREQIVIQGYIYL